MEFTDGLYGFGLPFLIILTVLVFVHELGHYWVARRCGVRVEVYSFKSNTAQELVEAATEYYTMDEKYIFRTGRDRK